MGTSHRHKPAGSPNWGNASKAVTQISKDVSESSELSNNPPQNSSAQKIAKRQSTLGKRISRSYHHAVRDMVRASGGRSSVAKGSSRVMGHSGVYYAGTFTSAFQEIAEQGLSTWLKDKGIGSIEGKTTKEIIELLSGFMHDYFTGLDDTAAREALEAVNDMVEEQVSQNGGDFDKTFQEVVSSELIKDYLDVFFGVYIYSHLSQSFSERLQKNCGFEEANSTMQEIKELIIDDVKEDLSIVLLDRLIGRVKKEKTSSHMNLIELFKYLQTMKIEVLDYKVSKKRGKKECDLIIPFSITSNSGQIEYSAAEIDMKMLSYFVGRIPVVATSFLYLSAIIYAIDRSVSRDRHSIDGWSRELDVVIKIPSYEAFDAQKELIERLLSYLTGDFWAVSFQEASSVRLTKYRDCDYFDSIAQVNLFSGGLDSLIGAIDFMSQYPEKKLFLASHYDSQMSGPRSDQERLLRHFALKYNGQYVVFPKRNSVRIVSHMSAETTCRSRSLMFIAIALQIAEYNKSKIIIPENGSVSLNYPLSPSRRSSCSTRTTHPVIVHHVRKLFECLGLSAKIENPYEFMTKGEMVRDCKDRPYLLSILPDSNSCGKRTRRQFFYDNKHATHCGHCMPCMYREASLIGFNDSTSYGNELDSLFRHKQLQLTDDFFAMLNFLKTDLNEDDIKRELRIAKVNELPNFDQYVNLVVKTRSELKALIATKGSSELKKIYRFDMIIDTHCHYDMMESPEGYINKVENTGNIVIGMTNLPCHFAMGNEHVRNFKKVRLALGFHPQLADEHKDELPLFAKYLGRTSYVGEIGLDFSSEYISTRDIQISCLKSILEVIQGKNKIISVHSRRAEKELFSLLLDYNIKNVIFHWYSGPLSLISDIISKGYYFSINEAMTLSASGRKIIEKIPEDRILTESDAPFNRKNDIASALRNLGLEENQIERNFFRLIKQIG